MMKADRTLGTNRMGFEELEPTELHAVEGGILAILIGMAGKAIADKLTEIVVEASDPNYIPIEPLT